MQAIAVCVKPDQVADARICPHASIEVSAVNLSSLESHGGGKEVLVEVAVSLFGASWSIHGAKEVITHGQDLAKISGSRSEVFNGITAG